MDSISSKDLQSLDSRATTPPLVWLLLAIICGIGVYGYFEHRRVDELVQQLSVAQNVAEFTHSASSFKDLTVTGTFELRDESGQARIRLSCTKANAEIKLLSSEGVGSIILQQNGDSGSLFVCDEHGKPKIMLISRDKTGMISIGEAVILGETMGEAELSLKSANGMGHLQLNTSAPGPSLHLNDKEGILRVNLSATSDRSGLMLGDKTGVVRTSIGSCEFETKNTGTKTSFSESSIHLLDNKGKIIWFAGQ